MGDWRTGDRSTAEGGSKNELPHSLLALVHEDVLAFDCNEELKTEDGVDLGEENGLSHEDFELKDDVDDDKFD